MRKLHVVLLALTLSVAMLVATVVPVLAATPVKLTFTTGLLCNGLPVLGSLDAGFELFTSFYTNDPDGLLNMTLASPKSDPNIENGLYPFFLQSNPAEKAILMAYFEAKWKESSDPTEQAYLTQITAEINGDEPFFYLKADSGVYSLVDGFVYGLTGSEAQTLRINNDYPTRNYMFTGELTGTNEAVLPLSVKLKVYESLQNYPDGSVKVDLYTWQYTGAPFGALVEPVVGSVILNTTANGKLQLSVDIDSVPNLQDFDVQATIIDMEDNWVDLYVWNVIDTNAKGQGHAIVNFDVSDFEDFVLVMFGVFNYVTPPAPPDSRVYAGWALVPLK